jgi:Zn-dependent protease
VQIDVILIVGIIIVVVLSITSHEAMHGFVADRLGDPTARELGRLTLNPIPHIDLFFTILLPAFLVFSGSHFIFGGAKPVPVDVSRLHNPRRDWALVGAAGPLSNILLAVLLSALLSVFLHMGLFTRSSIGTEILVVGIFVNVLLAIFNLIPIPPLDGSRVTQYFLSREALAVYRKLEQFGLIIILFLVLFVGPVQILLAAAIITTLEILAAIFGISAEVEFVLKSLLSG